MSWTDDILNVSLSSLVRVKLTNIPVDVPLDSLATIFDPSKVFPNDQRFSSSLMTTMVLHDVTQAAECEYYEDYGMDLVPSRTLLLGKVRMKVASGGDGINHISLPVIFAPSTLRRTKSASSGKEIQGCSSCTGFFFRKGMSCIARADSVDLGDSLRSTFLHEMIHCLRHSLPHLDDEMYGEGDKARTEEIMTHMVTDHFNKLANIATLNFVVKSSVIELQRRNEKGKLMSTTTMTLHDVEDVKNSKGESLVGGEAVIDCNLDSKEIYSKIKKENLY